LRGFARCLKGTPGKLWRAGIKTLTIRLPLGVKIKMIRPARKLVAEPFGCTGWGGG